MHLRIFQGSTFNLKGDWADDFINNNGMANAKTKVAAKRLLVSSNLNDAAISELAVLCQQEANNEFPDMSIINHP